MRLRTSAIVIAVTALTLALVPPVGASVLEGSTTASAGFTSDNVEWISVKPQHSGSAGGVLHEGYFYITDPRGVSIYDVTDDPADPTLVGSAHVFQGGTSTGTATGVALGQEDPDTNGEILLLDAIDPNDPTTDAQLLVIDVSDKTAPAVIAAVDVNDHTWTCVLDCTYAYGRSGHIIDLTDPSNPVHTDADWRDFVDRPGYTHDFTEVRPGFLMSAGQPSYYLDVRDPLAPVQLAKIDTRFHTLGFHSALWDDDGTDPLLLMGTELAPPGTTSLAGSDCDGPGGLFTYDATEVLEADRFAEENPDEARPPAEFEKLGDWRLVGRGAYADGKAPAHVLYCEHWFDTHPDFDGGGLVAMGHYTSGTRFLEIAEDGSIEEIGWFQPPGGYTGAAYWITEEIVYTSDYVRGMDILRFDAGTD